MDVFSQIHDSGDSVFCFGFDLKPFHWYLLIFYCFCCSYFNGINPVHVYSLLILTRISDRTPFLCVNVLYLFIWHWVLRNIWKHWNSHVRCFVRMCFWVWAIRFEQRDELWFECACFMSVIQENEDLYLTAHITHKHIHSAESSYRNLCVLYCIHTIYFFAILLSIMLFVVVLHIFMYWEKELS